MKQKSRKNDSPTRRRLGIESLENRRVLAGNVTAFVNGAGDLIVQGDSNHNMIGITRGAQAGEVVVTGYIDPTSSQLTTINGIPTYGPVTLSGFRGSVIADLGAGDDVACVYDIDIVRNLNVNLGTGNDSLGVGSFAYNQVDLQILSLDGRVTTHADVVIDAGAGDDVVNQQEVTINGNALILGGDGDDTLRQRAADHIVKDGHFRNAYTVLPGNGDDVTTVYGAQIGGQLTVDDPLANGFQTSLVNVVISVLNDTYINTSDQNDRVGFLANSGRNLVIRTNGGIDSTLIQSNLLENLTLDTGAGDDSDPDPNYWPVSVQGNEIRSTANISTGDGNDKFLFWNNTGVDRLFADLGAGDDIGVFDSAVSVETNIYGGIGNDWLRLGGASPLSFGRTQVITGDGNDFAWFMNTTTSEVLVDTGNNADELKIENSTSSLYRVLLGAGNDQLTGFFTVNVTSTSNQSFYDGGPGTDRWDQLALWPYSYTVRNFEVIV